MYVSIKWDNSDEQAELYALEENDILDCDIYAEKFADLHGFSLDEPDGHIPLGCADFTVELVEEPNIATCWTSKSYFIAAE